MTVDYLHVGYARTRSLQSKNITRKWIPLLFGGEALFKCIAFLGLKADHTGADKWHTES